LNNLKKEIVFKGTVISGSGRGEYFVNLPWAKRQFQEKLGFNPYPGSILIVPEEGYEKGHCFRALVNGKIWGAAVVLDFPGYPPDLLEIMAAVNLRQTLSLHDGMEIEVTVKIE
jgi:riboflavin kinase